MGHFLYMYPHSKKDTLWARKVWWTTPLLSSADGQGVGALQAALQGPERSAGDLVGDRRDGQEVLRVALQAQVDTQETRSKNQVRKTPLCDVLCDE